MISVLAISQNLTLKMVQVILELENAKLTNMPDTDELKL
jgi:hypothetical protein